MSLRKIASVVLLTTTAVIALAGAQSSQPNRPWPPGVQKISNQSPPLSPEDALKTFYMPPGYRVELVASEPMVQEPVAMDWDIDGRLWIVEMPGFMANLTGSNELEPIGRVVVLEDANGDGRMDDLNGDRRVDYGDTQQILRAVERVEKKFPELVGGLGLYAGMGPAGPFAHVDVRGLSARWSRE
jgi:hypothetical protein